MPLSKSTIKTIQATANVIAPLAGEITTRFYNNMFTNNPEMLRFFNKANQASGKQQGALAHAIIAYASNIDNLGVLGPAVELMAAKHCGLQVLPQHYPIVEKNLMLTVGEVIGDAATEDVVTAWTEAVQYLSGALIAREEELYKEAEERKGGWRDWQSFTITDRTLLTSDTALFTFERKNGNNTPFDFTPGQFLTLRAPFVSPRHYTVVSSPGESFLQCAVKLVKNGRMSTMLHNEVEVGNVIDVSPPFGCFNANNEKDAVLISAGIGVTPMVAFQKSLGGRVKNIIHIDRKPETHAFLDFQKTANCNKKYFYTQGGGEPFYYLINEIAVAATNNMDKDTEYYVCAPKSFQKDIELELNKLGVSSISYETFGPQLGNES